MNHKTKELIISLLILLGIVSFLIYFIFFYVYSYTYPIFGNGSGESYNEPNVGFDFIKGFTFSFHDKDSADLWKKGTKITPSWPYETVKIADKWYTVRTKNIGIDLVAWLLLLIPIVSIVGIVVVNKMD